MASFRLPTMNSTTVDRPIGLLNLAINLFFLVVFVAGMTASSQINRYFVSQAKLYFYNNINNHFSAVQIPNPTLRNCSFEANLTHGFSDNELFWRASMVPRRAEYPFKRVPKVAFMFLTRGPLPMMPLWERFFEGYRKYFSVYVHALPGFELNVSMHSAFYKRQIPSKAIDHIINSAAKSNYMSAGQLSVPIVFRGPNGAAAGVGVQHSQDGKATTVEMDESQTNQEVQLQKLVNERLEEIKLVARKLSLHQT